MPQLLAVADEVHVLQDFTADPNTLDDTFAKISANGGAAPIIDGVSLACDLLAKKPEAARRVIVVISGSRDLGSKLHLPDVIVKAQKINAVVYTVSYSAYATAFTQKSSDRPPPPDQPGLYDSNNHGGVNLLAIPALLHQLAKQNLSDGFAQATGGAHGKFTTLHGLENELTAIGTEIHSRYTLTFVPPELEAAGYHQLSVSVRTAGEWRVHARAGYWSGSE